MTEIRFRKKRILENKYSRYVSLPIVWIEEHDLRPGDEVDIIRQEDGTLRLQPISKKVNQ